MKRTHTRKAVEVGDVIMSPLFSQGWEMEDGFRRVGQVFGRDIEGDSESSRAASQYVVVERNYVMETEGTTDCWKIFARRLGPDGSYNPDGEGIVFYMESDYNTPYIDEVELVGKMRPVRTLTFENIDP